MNMLRDISSKMKFVVYVLYESGVIKASLEIGRRVSE